jgi:ATP-dependent DNA helicase RecG
MNPEDQIEHHFRLVEQQKKAFGKLGIKKIQDILWHFPVRYGDTSRAIRIGTVTEGGVINGQSVVIFGKITQLKISRGFKSKIAMATARIADESGSIKAVWFHQPYIAKMIAEGALVRVEGKVSERRKKNATGNVMVATGALIPEGASGNSSDTFYFSNPKIETVSKLPVAVGDSLFGKEGEAHSLYPIYPESQGITSNWFYHALQKIFASGILDSLGAADPIPPEILARYHLPSLKTALIWIHSPQKQDDALAARKRFAFEEIFFIQLSKLRERKKNEQYQSFTINKNRADEDVADFIKRFPFTPTSAQTKAIDVILEDFKKGKIMSRLLEGDVGSGKTAVAAVTAYTVATSRPRMETSLSKTTLPKNIISKTQDYGNLQVAYMAPTEILAKQHFESFVKYFRHLPINIALITGAGCKKFPSKVERRIDRATGKLSDDADYTEISRTQLLKWVANGEIPILIGTHALIQKTVRFKHLAYIIIDEQHRFGTAQRQKLAQKNMTTEIAGKNIAQNAFQNAFQSTSQNTSQSNSQNTVAPHLLSMTATPIPRTLALTIYGDLDLTLLDEMPVGRKAILTEIVLPSEKARTDVYEKIRLELMAGRQVYVICARIDEPDPAKEKAVNARSVTEEAARLKRSVFQEYSIGILHSKMTPAAKDAVMLDFADKKIDILVATSVVEVGVNVPNATVIVIEGAERFGLAQLHQLRGRVIRGTHQAYCYLFAEAKSQKTIDRLNALKKARNGFELAEHDLALRGSGELYGRKQWGLSDIAMEAIKNIKMVEAARTEAVRLIDEDSSLANYPLLRERIEQQGADIHFE